MDAAGVGAAADGEVAVVGRLHLPGGRRRCALSGSCGFTAATVKVRTQEAPVVSDMHSADPAVSPPLRARVGCRGGRGEGKRGGRRDTERVAAAAERQLSCLLRLAAGGIRGHAGARAAAAQRVCIGGGAGATRDSAAAEPLGDSPRVG